MTTRRRHHAGRRRPSSPFTLRPELQLGDDAPLGLTSLSIVVGPATAAPQRGFD